MNYVGVKPTKYAGITFRSRLEARWALFFDALDIGWEYEPETFVLPGGQYTPDFRLDVVAGLHHPRLWEGRDGVDHRLFVEVKPTMEAARSVEQKLNDAVDGHGPCGAGLLLLGPVPCWRNGLPLHPLLVWEKGVSTFLVSWARLAEGRPGATVAYHRQLSSGIYGLAPAAELSDRQWGADTGDFVARSYDAARNERFGLGAPA